MKNKNLQPRNASPVLLLGAFSAAPTNRRNGASLSERVYQALKQDIIRGVFRPGEALSKRISRRDTVAAAPRFAKRQCDCSKKA